METTKTVSEIIAKNIKNVDSLFVFPSDVSKKSWIDWTINNPKESGVKAFNLDEFMAWDDFRSSFLQTEDENLECIPDAIRKLFAEKIIAENTSSKNPFLKNILPCKTEYKENAFALTDWLSGVLPSLKLLKSLCKESHDEGEIKDYIELYNRYEKFLKKYGFYEPSYLDVSFKENGRKIFIFYPEILLDFYEFKEVLENAENVTLVKLPENVFEEKPNCVFFSNTRKELRYLALSLRKFQIDGVDLRTVAVNVPDIDSLRPYLERELSLYSVPYIVRSGIPCTKNCSGDLFLKIREVASSNFSYDSVRSLLLDRYIPWNEKTLKMNNQLVRKGQDMRCICNYEKIEKGEKEKKDIWCASLTCDKDDKKGKFYSMLKEHYIKLKDAVEMFCNAKSFSSLMNAWNNFRQKFLNEEDEDKPDNILGWIITELSSLVDLEKHYLLKDSEKNIDYAPRSPFDFFINEIQQTPFALEQKDYGVNIFPYCLASSADFDYQFVINASQKSISVPLKKLSFIVDSVKREKLGLDKDDKDRSTMFIHLYEFSQKKKGKKVFFSAAEKSLDGFSIVHTELNSVKFEKEKGHDLVKKLKGLDSLDFVSDEKRIFSAKTFKEGENKTEHSQLQKRAFEYWKETFSERKLSEFSSDLKERVKNYLTEIKNTSKDKYKVSSTGMKSFFNCPRSFLFANVLKLSEDSLDCSLIEPYDVGNLIHKILELVLGEWRKEKYKKIPILTEENRKERCKEIKDLVETKFEEAKETDRNFGESLLAKRVIENQKDFIVNRVCEFLQEFCSEPNEETKNKCFGGFTIVGLEDSIEAPCEKSEFNFYGRIDCVLSPSEESFERIIVDFKTGSAPSFKASTAQERDGFYVIEDFQIACYVQLLENDPNNKKNKVDVTNALFYQIKRKDTEKKSIVKVISEGDENNRSSFDLTLKELKKYAEYFYDQCKNNNFKPLVYNKTDKKKKKYGINVYSDCVGCKFNSICRTSFNISKNELN